MRPLLLLICALPLSAVSYVHHGQLSLYSEGYDLDGSQTRLSSLFANFSARTLGTADEGKWRFEATVNGIVATEDPYDIYAFDTAKAMVAQLGYEYLFSDWAFSLGRSKIDLPMLHGSFDGAVALWVREHFSGRAFLFHSYETLLPAYYKRDSDIEGNLGGLTLSYESESLQSLLFSYREKAYRYNGAQIALTLLDETLAGYEIVRLDSDIAGEKGESFQKLHIDYAPSEWSFELGMMQSGEAGLDAIYRYGKNELNLFGLGNMLYLPDARNGYGILKYGTQNFFTQFLLGKTAYNTETQKGLHGTEINLSVLYRFTPAVDLSVSYISQKVDPRDQSYVDITYANTYITVSY